MGGFFDCFVNTCLAYVSRKQVIEAKFSDVI